MKPCQELSLTSRISDERRTPHCQFLPSMKSMLVLRACPTKAFSEYLVETIFAFVEALGHNVVMLHSDQEPVLVQLLKVVQSRRVKRTLVRHGPRASHQSQGKIENANRVINGVCRAMWLSLEDLLREKTTKRQHLDSVVDSTCSMVLDEISSEKRRENCVCACFGKAHTRQVLPFGEKVMCKYTSVPTGNLEQKWGRESGLARRQRQTNTSFSRKLGSRKRDRRTACHRKKDS